jgi:thiol-disulfide isomerase/thioredoxin
MTQKLFSYNKILFFIITLIIAPIIGRTTILTSSNSNSAQQDLDVSHGLQSGVVHYLHLLNPYKATPMQLVNHFIEHNKNIVIIFYEDWCPPCKRMTPMFEQIAPQYKDIIFLKIKRELYRSLFDAYQLKTVPAILFFKNGALKKIQPSSMTQAHLTNTINRIYG